MGIVAKFGGSSVRDSAAMKRCAEIVKNNPETQVVIISATYNTTNLLEELSKSACLGDSKQAYCCLEELQLKHLVIAENLGASDETLFFMREVILETKALLDKIMEQGSCSTATMDQLYSVGERLSSCLFTDSLASVLPNKKITYLDVRKILITDDKFGMAQPKLEIIANQCTSNLRPLLEDPDTIVVTQGFVGCTESGETTTLGREGSDFSATLIGEAISASGVQIWTDVPGIFTADPKLDPLAQVIPKISYDRATKMAEEGAKILFPKTLLPAKRKSIPVFIGSSLGPEQGGSLVSDGNV
jgi:aspartate kinase